MTHGQRLVRSLPRLIINGGMFVPGPLSSYQLRDPSSNDKRVCRQIDRVLSVSDENGHC